MTRYEVSVRGESEIILKGLSRDEFFLLRDNLGRNMEHTETRHFNKGIFRIGQLIIKLYHDK
jgi:hypothetical protein